MKKFLSLLLVALSCSFFTCSKDIPTEGFEGVYTGAYTEADANGSITLEDVKTSVSAQNETELTISIEVLAGTPAYVFTATVDSESILSIPEHTHPNGVKVSGSGELDGDVLTITLTGAGGTNITYQGTR